MVKGELTDELLLCHCCGYPRPASQFRRRQPGGQVRQDRCRDCRRSYMSSYRAARRSDGMAEFAAKHRAEARAGRVVAATAALIGRLGGVEAFASAMKGHFDASPPGSRRRSDLLLALLNLTTACDRPEPSDFPAEI